MTDVVTTQVVQGEIELLRRYGRQVGEVIVLGGGFVVGLLVMSGAGAFVAGLL